MPEILEVESYRRAAVPLIGTVIERVEAPDAWYLKGGIDAGTLRTVIVGCPIERFDRIGKLLIAVLGSGVELGLRFGMTGRLVVDGRIAIERLQYGSDQRRPEWTRFAVSTSQGHALAIDDPRRLGGVELAPNRIALGADALSVSASALGSALEGARGPIKARLMDQSRVAGLGNLLTDEVLWRAGIDPRRDTAAVTDAERRRLAEVIGQALPQLATRGGSHTGDLHEFRFAGAACPQPGCGGHIVRSSVGARTTYSCALHQR